VNISIIVPTLNEERSLASLLESLQRQAPGQIIVADGGSRDGTVGLARRMGAEIAASASGRGVQLNAGAARARGEGLFFVHADVRLPENAVSLVERALSVKDCPGGAFSIEIDSRRPSFRFIFRIINLRSRYLKLPLGDQGIFARKSVFESLGGFRNIPIMEDLDFVKRLNRMGRMVILPQKIIASARRYDQDGPVYSTLRNWFMIILFMGGVNPARLLKYYPHVR